LEEAQAVLVAQTVGTEMLVALVGLAILGMVEPAVVDLEMAAAVELAMEELEARAAQRALEELEVAEELEEAAAEQVLAI
jgi:hypothetical protein